MADTISATTKVYVFFFHPQSGERVYVTSVENQFDKNLNRLALHPKMETDPAKAQTFTFEYAARMRERFTADLHPVYAAHFAIGSPQGEIVGEGNSERGRGDDARVPMTFRNLLAVPGYHTQRGRVWYCRFPGTSIESICDETVEGAVNRVYDMKLEDRAERAPAPPTQAPEGPISNAGPRLRPGDRY
jgi:hypothetical protein